MLISSKKLMILTLEHIYDILINRLCIVEQKNIPKPPSYISGGFGKKGEDKYLTLLLYCCFSLEGESNC